MVALSYIVITFNRCNVVAKCISSLINLVGPDDELIVVDNGSNDGTADMLSALNSRVQVIRSEKNLGVAGGRNLGIKSAQGQICVFLDDDASFLVPDVSRRISEYLAHSPHVEGLAFTIIDANTGEEQTSSIPGRKKGTWNKPHPCSYFCGAGFAVRRSAFERFGFFWELLFYGGEELEFGYRVVKAGRHFLFVDDISVLHECTPLARPSGQYTYFHTRNRSLIALKHMPFPFVVSQTVIWWLYLAAHSGRARRAGPFLKGVRDFFKLAPGVFRVRRALSFQDLGRLLELKGRIVY